ncbi:MAG: DUF4465 domain-containing protein [Thermodesulfobacteriota bacterium]
MKKIIVFIAFALVPFILTGMVSAETVDFEDLSENPSLVENGYWNGSDGSGEFTSGEATFNNTYSVSEYDGVEYIYWAGFAYSNLSDTEKKGYDAQYNAIPGSGVKDSEIYAVAYDDTSSEAELPTITFDEAQVITGAYFTNTNYAYYAMKEGQGPASPFEEDDRFTLTITGIDENGDETGSVDFRLADGTDIVDSWVWVDLSNLGTVEKLTFSLDSTDKGENGINTPTYFAMDNLNEPTDNNEFDEEFDDDDNTCFINCLK